jgi:citryl-CoA lyase
MAISLVGANGKYWSTHVSRVDEARVLIRGYDLQDLIGGLPFSASCFLLIKGRLPDRNELTALDAVLNAVLDYGLQKPGTAAARYTVSGNPSMVAGMASAVLAAGAYTLAPEDSARFILDAVASRADHNESIPQAAQRIVAEATTRKARIPGFGHPVFKRVDPRAQKLRDVAASAGVWGERAQLYEEIHRVFAATSPKKAEMPINDVGVMAAVLVELGFTPEEMTGLAVLSTLPGVIAHISEEMSSGKRIRVIPDEIAEYLCQEHKDFAHDWEVAQCR